MIRLARPCGVPRDGLLDTYVEHPGAYTDCFEVMHPLEADLEAFITAFYTTWLFRLERLVLTISLRHWLRDSEVRALAKGQKETFAVWRVEGRRAQEILLCERSGRTRSYLAVSPKEGGVTRLVFGSAVVPDDGAELSAWVRWLIPAHRLYSKLLLRAAEKRLRRA